MDHRVIFHVDVNSAFLSWSAVDRLKKDPGAVDLRTIPSAVGGDVKSRHGVITAKSIPAKKYGVTTGEPVAQALRKCPGLVLVRSDFKVYRKYSKAFIAILHQYSPVVEQVSIDEAYLDMTGTESRFPGDGRPENAFPLGAAASIRRRIREELGFTVNVGISSNKLLAKMASDFAKPDRTHTLYPQEVPDKMWPLPIGKLHGCGRATAEKLRSLGIVTIGDAAHADLGILQPVIGDKAGEYIWNSSRGISNSEVHAVKEEAKGYSNETTTASDITADSFDTDAPPIVRRLSESVGARLRKDMVFAGTIGVSARTDDFHRHSRQQRLSESTNDTDVIAKTALRLLQELVFAPVDGLFSQGHSIRLIGVFATTLDHGEYRQLSLFDLDLEADPETKENPEEKEIPEEKGISLKKADNQKETARGRKLQAMMDEMNRKFGDGKVMRASQMKQSDTARKKVSK